MTIYYRDSARRSHVAGDSPVESSLDTALAVFRNLDSRSGFMGIILDRQFTVQFLPQKHGCIRIELLDILRPAVDACLADAAFAECLIGAAANGNDVFQIARASTHEWEHTDL